MHLMSGRWLGSSRDHPTIRSLEMLRSQTVEAVLSDTGNQMNSDSDPVGVGAGVLHRRAWQTPHGARELAATIASIRGRDPGGRGL